MNLHNAARRRWLGVAAVTAALGMLVAGQTVLVKRLHGPLFLVYWLCCFLFTILAMLVALWDARALRHQSRNEKRALLEDALKETETQARARSRKGNKSHRS